jgi:transcriptional regulator with XRE-family HTH domain
MEPTPPPVARAIRARRLELNLTVEQAAEQARIHVTSWRLLERGTLNPSTLMIRALCRVLDWTPATIEQLMHGALDVDAQGHVTVDLAEWPAQPDETTTDPAGGAAVVPELDVDGLTPAQVAEVQRFINHLRGEAER